jgi:AcrR family transcriptional regulator
MTRDYELKRRAEQMADTRRRIVEAAVDLHRSIGPSQTTVTAVAERAGVQRQTYYRHFPDEKSLLKACSSMDMERNPLPDPEEWREIADPGERLRHGLDELYGYYAANETLVANLIRDIEVHEATRDVVGRILPPALAEMHAALAEGLEGEQVETTIELVTDFHTWQLLSRRSGLSHEEAVDLGVRLASCAG